MDPAKQMRGKARRSARHGFTLIEILMVLALLSLVASLFLAGASDLFRSQERTPADIFWQAAQAARLEAVQTDKTVALRYDAEHQQLSWAADGAASMLPWPGKKLEFLPAEKRDAVLLGGQLTETGSMSAMRFYPDGGTDNLRVQITDMDDRVSQLELDPWTCAPIVHPDK